MRSRVSSFAVTTTLLSVIAVLSSCVQALGDFKNNATGGAPSSSSSSSSGTGGVMGSSSSSSGTSSSGTGGTGGTGGTATCKSCTAPTDCDTPTNDCNAATCEKGCCGVTNLQVGSVCATGGGKVCDTAGTCVECLNKAGCSATGTACATPTCSGGKCGPTDAPKGTACTDSGGMSCDGSGKCVACLQDSDCAATGTACATAACGASGACTTNSATSGTACTDSGGKLCDGSGKCVVCLQDADCPASNTVCASPACDATAHTCGSTFAAKGTACTDSGGVVCDGNGKCASAHCNDNLKDSDETDKDCGGSCAPCVNTKGCKVAADCVSLYCSGGTTCAPCATDVQCPNGDFCDTSNNGGTCTPKKPIATSCGGGNQCQSGFCANGVCCDGTCTGTCQACKLALTGQPDGKCASLLPGLPAPGGQCAANPPCGNDGKCAAGGVCEQASSTTQCGAVTCTSNPGKPGTLNQLGTCSGSGTCNPGTSGYCPGNVLCASGSACLNGCGSHSAAGDANCPTGYFCDGLGLGSCQAQKGPGSACGAPDQCQSGFCADGVCCTTACIGTCQSCNLPGTPGTCGSEPDNGNNASHPCFGAQVCCSGSCTGTQGGDVNNCGSCGSVCQPPPTLCKKAVCFGGACAMQNQPGGTSCNDSGGHLCDGNGNCVQCLTNADCAAPTTCGGGGIPNACGCTPKSCTSAGAQCGQIGDGCGGQLDCGTCTAPQACCGNACLNVSSDPQNCGACGHGCLGGACSNGQCQPVVLATGQNQPLGIATDGTRVYWVNQGPGTVMACSVPNCMGTIVQLAGGQATPFAITLNATHLVWTNSTNTGSVWSYQLPSGPAFQISANENLPQGIATDGTYAYWANNGNGTVKRCATAGCGGVSATLLSGLNTPTYVAVDASFFYVSNTGNNTVWRGPLAGGGAQLITNANNPQVIAVDALNAYWNSANGTGVWKGPIAGGAGSQFGPGSGVNGITIDATYIYYGDQSANTISRVPLAGGPQVVIAMGQGQPRKLANDAVSVYWTNSGSGQIMRIAK